MRLIDADALERILINAITIIKSLTVALDAEDDKEFQMEIKAYTDILNGVKEQPTIEPERKNGNWTKDCACEICGFKPWYERDIHTLSFCPNCGADMREETDAV